MQYLIQPAINLLNENLTAILFGVFYKRNAYLAPSRCRNRDPIHNFLTFYLADVRELENIIQYIEYFEFSIYKILSSRLFTEEEIEEIRNITLSDILLATKTLEKQHVPKDAFSIHNRMLLNY